MAIKTLEVPVGTQKLILEIGRFGEQTNACVTARIGDTMVLVTAVMGRLNPNLGYFPLSVEYQEKLYAGGRIKGSRWVKREGRPTDDAILTARLIDRSIRPLFPKNLLNEIQLVATVLSVDGVNDADMPAMYAASAALAWSDIPWEGPISAVRIGLDQETNEFIVNPTFEQKTKSNLDLILSGTQKVAVMVEAGANEISESQMLQAFTLAQKENTKVAKAIDDFAKELGITKVAVSEKVVDVKLVDAVTEFAKKELDTMVKRMAKLEPSGKDELITKIIEANPDFDAKVVGEILDDLLKKAARHLTLDKGLRPDGRKLDEIRPLSSEVGLLPRTHGSAMFKRGSTQALTITTLGPPAMNQLIENMEGEEEKRYIHHYIMPPYSVGETGRLGWPSRREIGHGALAERALEPMIPAVDVFPYTIRIVSELLSSNGSTSMASVCGSTLSLMDAGVPLKKPVAGIAMGLLMEGDNYVILTDIQGLEDHTGDMDFKVAGTKDGITAMQMDLKVKGISLEILEKALSQAKTGRLFILNHMLSTLAAPRSNLSVYAPKIVTVTIPVDRIGDVIGPGGRIIRGIIEDSGAEVDIEEDGRVFISSTSEEAIAKAKTIVEGIVKEVMPGEEYDGKVTRIENFGAFIEVAPGKNGLVHVSQLSPEYISHPSDVVKLGDTLHVRVTEIDSMGRINLTTLTPEQEAQVKSRRETSRNSGGGGHRGGGGGGGYRPSGRQPFHSR